MNNIHITSGYGGNTKQPFIELEVTMLSVQLSPAKAREIALMLLEAADAAESGTFVVEFLQEHLEADLQSATALLVMFRQYRDHQRGKRAESA